MIRFDEPVDHVYDAAAAAGDGVYVCDQKECGSGLAIEGLD
ncbi:MAG: hypothetical protein P8L45_00885 [Longimicrobiales bacterium]|nr:hypothetical protein [Longimicrobiales bacterium]